MRKSLFCLVLSIFVLGGSIGVAQEGAVVKKPMIEVFTASTCPPCTPGNIAIDGVLAQFPGTYSLVKYQMNWPGSGDPYFLEESLVRKDYYEVSGVPHMRSNGFIPHTPNWYPQQYVVEDFESLLSAKTNISITAEASVDESMVITSHVEIRAHAAYAAGLKAYIIAVEGNTFGNVGTNGETEFHNVVMGFLSGSEGIDLGDLEADQVLTYDLSIDLSNSFTETGNDLSLVVFVQNHSTTMVEQSEMVEISHPFVDYSAIFNFYDDDYNKVEGGRISVELGGMAGIIDSKAEVAKLLPGTYYYEAVVPGLFPYEGEFTITDADVEEDVMLEIPPFLFYEDFENLGIPGDWTIFNPQEDYFAFNSGRLVYQNTHDGDSPLFFTLPKVDINQGSVLSFKAGESSGSSNIAVGVVTDPENPLESFTEIINHEIFGLPDNLKAFGARIDDPAAVGDGYLTLKITSSGGNFFYLDDIIIIENMPGYKVQFKVLDQNEEILPEVEVTFMEETMATNDFGLATWRDIDEAVYNYSVSYKGEEIENGTVDVWEDMVKEITWNTTGIDQISKELIEVYPNPASSNIYIKGVNQGTLNILDMEGRVLKETRIYNDTNINVSDLPEGIYILSIQVQDKTTISKIVIAR